MIWYFAFHKRSRESLQTIFGHVDLIGTQDGYSWVHMRPELARFEVFMAHGDPGSEFFAVKVAHADSVLRYDREPDKLRFPPLTLQTCASVCGHVVGIRAFTPWGLKRKLLQNGAEILK